jgi:CRISPR-associated endonuclease Csn1
MTSQISDNENTNQRIKLLLMELKHDSNIENVREYSPTQQEILKIYEEYAINNEEKYDGKDKNGNDKFINEPIPEDIVKISKTAQPTKAEINLYKLWLEQKYRSPYTGQMIPLSKLFTSAYEIEHVIPKSRYFDDSLSNKVICESAVNKLKDNQLGLEFIKNHFGQKLTFDGNKEVTIFTEEQYKTFIDEHYAKNKAKRTKFLLEEIPDKMIARQMNDTRYISKFISQVLSNIVRADKDDDGVNSKNIIPGNGKITTRLKQDWGLNDVWNELVLPRFERMNILTKEVEIAELEKGFDEQKNKLEKENISDEEKNNQFKQLEKKFNEKIKELDSTDFFITKNKEGHTIPAIPFKLSKGFQKKRIDHRHHAMDALVIACATRSHVNYLNNVSAKTEDLKNEERKKKQIEQRNKLKNTLCYKTKPDKDGNYKWIFEKPWENFTTDTKNELEKIVVSFKQVLGYKKDLRVINKATNKYEKIENGKKVKVEQKGTNWAIRKPMHEETVSGLVNLPWVKLGKGEFTTATRKSLDKNFNLDKIEKVTDIGIQTILRNYLTQEKFKYEEKGEIKYNSELAFSPEGIEELNKNISQYNNGKFHQPIFKVRTYEKGKGRFVLGEKGNKKSKYVQGAPNLFSGVYSDKDGNISFETIPLDKVIERQKQKLNPVPEKITIEKKKEIHELNLQFHLSPDDLVYVPTKDEQGNLNMVDFNNLTKEQKKRIFFVNDFSGSTCYFRPNHIAKNIVPKEVDLSFDEKKKKPSGSFDTKTANLDGNSIKDICIKLKVDRLGNISKA